MYTVLLLTHKVSGYPGEIVEKSSQKGRGTGSVLLMRRLAPERAIDCGGSGVSMSCAQTGEVIMIVKNITRAIRRYRCSVDLMAQPVVLLVLIIRNNGPFLPNPEFHNVACPDCFISQRLLLYNDGIGIGGIADYVNTPQVQVHAKDIRIRFVEGIANDVRRLLSIGTPVHNDKVDFRALRTTRAFLDRSSIIFHSLHHIQERTRNWFDLPAPEL